LTLTDNFGRSVIFLEINSNEICSVDL
jgi:hypothetical protein